MVLDHGLSERGSSRFRDPLPTSGGTSLRERGGRPRAGQGKSSPGPTTKQKPDPTMARAHKRLASRFYQLKTGHCLTGQYLAWTTRRPDATCWCIDTKIWTREHLFKNCPQWKSQQKTLWRPSSKRPGSSRSHPGQGPYKDRGTACRRAVQPSGPQFFSDNGGRQDGKLTDGKGSRRGRPARPQTGRRGNGRSGWRR